MKRLPASLLILLFLFSTFALGQKSSTGTIKGKIRSFENEKSLEGVTVTVMEGEREIKSVLTNRKGDFVLSDLPPGIYSIRIRKPGFSIGTIEKVEVRAGKTNTLKDRLLPADEGSFAFIRGTVFDAAGMSIKGIKVELGRVGLNGTVKNLDSRYTDISGSFSFRLPIEKTKYQVSVKLGNELFTKTLDVEGAAIYRVALSPTTKD
jgi:hypothetical protein